MDPSLCPLIFPWYWFSIAGHCFIARCMSRKAPGAVLWDVFIVSLATETAVQSVCVCGLRWAQEMWQPQRVSLSFQLWPRAHEGESLPLFIHCCSLNPWIVALHLIGDYDLANI